MVLFFATLRNLRLCSQSCTLLLLLIDSLIQGINGTWGQELLQALHDVAGFLLSCWLLACCSALICEISWDRTSTSGFRTGRTRMSMCMCTYLFYLLNLFTNQIYITGFNMMCKFALCKYIHTRRPTFIP